MSPRRGERAAPPPGEEEHDLRFASNEAADGWEKLGRHAAGNLRRAFDIIRADPRSRSSPERHHRLKGSLGTATWKGETLERWHALRGARQTQTLTNALPSPRTCATRPC